MAWATWGLLVCACGGADGSGGGADAAAPGLRRDAGAGTGTGGEVVSAHDAVASGPADLGPEMDTAAPLGGALPALDQSFVDAEHDGASAFDAATADARVDPPSDAAPHRDAATVDAEAVTPPAPARFDLAADFSEVANPNGPWSFRAGDALVPAFQDAWGFIADQRAWAFSAQENGFTPAFMRVESVDTGFTDAALGDFVVHSQDEGSGAGFGVSRIVFTSPRAGHVDVSGALWPARDIGRSNAFVLFVAGQDVATGAFFDGDPWSRATPLSLADAGAVPLNGLAVAAGDEIVLEVVRTSDFGDAVGVSLSIVLAE